MPKQHPAHQRHYLLPRPHWFLLSGLVAVLLISQLLMNHSPQLFSRTKKAPEDVRRIEQPILKAEDLWEWKVAKVLNGDSLSKIFKRMNVPSTTLDKVLASDEKAKQLTKLLPGHEIRFAFNKEHQLMALQFTPSKRENLNITKNPDASFNLDYIIKTPETRIVYRSASLRSSLFADGKKAGFSQNTIYQISTVFNGVIDFVNDTHAGDTFDALYEEQYIDGERIDDGKLLAASYSGGKESYTAYRYEFKDGTVGFYNPEGMSMRKTFLRAPLDFIRVSSEFNPNRYHPVHKKFKAHRGIDYSAPRGTPVYAAGDGIVSKAGYSPANGNFVFIQHTREYSTKYLHFDKRLVRTGQRVKQGDMIGTVGTTGYSTGPHLHYEFLLNGVHRNPRDIAKLLPPAIPIPGSDKKRFEEQIRPIKAEYEKNRAANLKK
jgi:murein DD-endopeptidase MepM/ murein hydrolase activator NlpD